MGNTSGDKRSFVMCPSALLFELSDTALRIILYAKYRQGLVDIGRLAKWDLTIVDIHEEFKKFKGYCPNKIRDGIRELKALNLLIFHKTHYRFNGTEFEKWYYRSSSQGVPNPGRGQQPTDGQEGLPKSGRGGLPNSGKAGVPNSGSQEKSNKEKRKNRVENPKNGAPVNAITAQATQKNSMAEFEKLFPESRDLKVPAEKSFEDQFNELFGAVASGENINQSLSACTPPPSDNPIGTAKATDTQKEKNDCSARPTDNADKNNHPIPSGRPEKLGELPSARPKSSAVERFSSCSPKEQLEWLEDIEADKTMEEDLRNGMEVRMTAKFIEYFANL
jgi:hypothetical protein